MRTLSIAALLLVSSLAQVVDRVVATVNGRVITQSEWEEQERFEALMDKRDPQSLKFNAASLERVIDHTLIGEQLTSLRITPVTPEEVTQQIKEIREQLGIKSDTQWLGLLRRYQLDAEEFNEHLAEQLTVMRFVNMRFRPRVQVSELQVEEYYHTRFVPELQKKGIAQKDMPPLPNVREQITQILVEQHMDAAFTTWLETLRSQSQIRRFLKSAKE